MTPTLLAVFAHPDDESYRAGGTLAMLASKGVDIQVITATRGERGIPTIPPSEAKVIREKELRCACRVLGFLPPRFLDYPDGELSSIDEIEAVAYLTGLIRELQPDFLLTWPPSGISGHEDHQVISEWTRKSFLQAANPAYLAENLTPHAVPAFYYLALSHSVAEAVGFHDLHSIPDEEISLNQDVRTIWDQKMSAIHCHRSQIDHSPIMKMDQTQQEIFLGKEQFVCVYHSFDDADLFSCLGIIGSG
jgi:LmbE family N-acetylglucosaminyl deacetylase